MSGKDHDSEFSKLVAIISDLRAENGCPWDRKQTPETIKKYLLEETNELAEAILKGDHDHVREEIGDLFFILILLTKTYEEKQNFTINDVLKTIAEKMVRRHPHVFSGIKTGSESELRKQWEEIKAMEKSEQSRPGDADSTSK